MDINYYRQHNLKTETESWQDCQFTSETDLSGFTAKPLVTLNGQHILQQHHVSYLTGKETCRAHHFAKFLAINILSSPSSDARVLWIDTLHGPHICSRIYHELVDHATDEKNLHLVCLDMLGGQRDNVFAISRNIEALISMFKPTLVVIDDIDHLMPFCGINVANEFCRIVRDVTNHTDTAFLFIGYNHLNKRTSTTGNLGKFLFIQADHVFTLSTQREVTTVRLARSYNLSRNPNDSEFHFTIGADNLPHETDRLPGSKTVIDDTLRDIISEVIQPGQAITPDEFLKQVNTRQRQLKRQHRADDLITQALHLNLLRHCDGNRYTTTGSGQIPDNQPSKTDNDLIHNNIETIVNT